MVENLSQVERKGDLTILQFLRPGAQKYSSPFTASSARAGNSACVFGMSAHLRSTESDPEELHFDLTSVFAMLAKSLQIRRIGLLCGR